MGNIPTAVLPDVPIIYISNNPSELVADKAFRERSTGMWLRVDVRKTVEAARRLQPKARKLLVISGAGKSDVIWLAQFRNQLKDPGPGLDIEYDSDSTLEQLRARLSHLSPDTIVLPIAYGRDAAGNYYITPDAIASMAEVSTAPIYAISDTYLEHGTVGGYVANWEQAGELAAGMALEILHGKPPADVVAPPTGTGHYVFDWRQLKRWGFSERDLPPDSVIEHKIPTAWEQYRWRIVGILALVLLQSFLIIGLLINRNHRQQAEASLRDMTGRLLESQDDERRRIARDLHDGTGQQLSGMALTIGQVLADFPPGHDRLRQLLQDSHTASRQALDEVRTVSYVLHPPILDGLGLVSALRWYLDGLQKRTDLKVDFEAPPEIWGLGPEAERALFRIVQESVTNVLRHSGGTMLRVDLSNHGKAVTLQILDNGHGMSGEQLADLEGAATLGVGIAGMRERVRQLGGAFKIESGPSGTRVTASVPANDQRFAANSAG